MSEDWQQHYLEGHMPWDKGEAAPPLIDWITKNPNQLAGKILVPGCGRGHDVRAIAMNQPEAEVIGLDISPKALEMAAAYPNAGSEKYIVDDLFTLSPDAWQEQFDWVWEHTCFCAIDPEQRDNYVQSIYQLLKPNGNFLAVFYLNPYDNEHRRGGGPPHGCSIEELHQRFCESGSFSIVDQYVPSASYPGRENLELMIHFKKG